MSTYKKTDKAKRTKELQQRKLALKGRVVLQIYNRMTDFRDYHTKLSEKIN